MKKVLLSLLPLFLLTSCIDINGQYFDTNPLLKIEVRDTYNRLVPGAEVTLFDNETDYLNYISNRPSHYVRKGYTNSRGEIIFDELYPYVYFFDVFYETPNGLILDNADDVNFTKYALRPGAMLTVRTYISPSPLYAPENAAAPQRRNVENITLKSTEDVVRP